MSYDSGDNSLDARRYSKVDDTDLHRAIEVFSESNSQSNSKRQKESLSEEGLDSVSD